jgi:hypothetical protein
MPTGGAGPQRFRARLGGSAKGRVYLTLPFDPAAVWGPRARYHVRGTIQGAPFRGPVEPFGQGHLLSLGPAYRRDRGLGPGDDVEVVLDVEGPQREGLAPDVAAALEDEPAAAAFFDSLATFYRKGYLRWIDATKRRPEVRTERIAQMVALLKAGRKERPG